MRFNWRTDPLSGHAEWRARIAKKDDQPGRSAPTLAAAWAGPAELCAALARVPELADLQIETVDVEVQTAFDRYPGGKRNHDLVVSGVTPGGRVVVCVEAKAGESFGQTVGEYADAGERLRARGKSTNAPERLDDLLAQWLLPTLTPVPDSAPVRELRYQLFAAVAGTVAEALKLEADHAVLMIHEFQTDERQSADNNAALQGFASAVFGQHHLPDDDDLPWCVELAPQHATPPNMKLYLAKAVTDLRPRA